MRKLLLCLAFTFECSYLLASPAIDTSPNRFKTDINPPYAYLGTVIPKDSSETRCRNVTLGCETLDRDYADYHKYKDYITPLGIKKIRLIAGWAKTEKRKGVYDFKWLDDIISDAVSRGLTPYILTCYGNPIYEGGGSPMLAGGMPVSKEAKDAWDKWIEALARRYAYAKPEWEMWNEPDISKNFSAEETVDINIRTAKIIKSVIPDAKISALTLARFDRMNRVKALLKGLHKADAFGLFEWISHHGYRYRPEEIEPELDALEAELRKYDARIKLRQSELGAPSRGRMGGALDKYDWSELTQAKWDVRRMMQDLGRGSQSSVFSISDMRYGSGDMIKIRNVKGLLESDENHNIVKIKKAYYAVQNLMATIDILSDRLPSSDIKFNAGDIHSKFLYKEAASGLKSAVLWLSGSVPSDSNALRYVDIEIKNAKFINPVWLDLISGRVYKIPPEDFILKDGNALFKKLPIYDSPVLVTEARLLKYGN